MFALDSFGLAFHMFILYFFTLFSFVAFMIALSANKETIPRRRGGTE